MRSIRVNASPEAQDKTNDTKRVRQLDNRDVPIKESRKEQPGADASNRAGALSFVE